MKAKKMMRYLVRPFLIISILLFLVTPHTLADPINDAFVEAAKRGDAKTVKAMIDAGVNFESPSQNGQKAIVVAPYYLEPQCVEVVKVLILAGADVNAQDTFDHTNVGKNSTALHVAARAGRTATVKLLLESGANPDIKNERGKIPMGLAAEGGYADIITLLSRRPSDSGKTQVAGQMDRILLKNGDVVTGKIVTQTFEVKTSYGGSLSFTHRDVKSVSIEGGGLNIDIIFLRNGDKLSGVVYTDTIAIQLADQQKTELSISKDKIKEIQLK